MEKELEIEYKSLITKEKYEELLKELDGIATKQESYTQINHFFDCEGLLLNDEGVTLRIRFKKEKWQLTAKLKQKKEKKNATYSLEFNETISEEQAEFYFASGLNADNSKLVKEMIEVGGLEQLSGITFHYIGKLKTYRTDFDYDGDTISLDMNTYGPDGKEIVDYEFEMESADDKVNPLNEKLKLEFGNGKGKRKRFIKTLKKLS